jgi:hypothetical protein
MAADRMTGVSPTPHCRRNASRARSLNRKRSGSIPGARWVTLLPGTMRRRLTRSTVFVGEDVVRTPQGPAVEQEPRQRLQAAPVFGGIDALKDDIGQSRLAAHRGSHKIRGLVVAVIGQPEIGGGRRIPASGGSNIVPQTGPPPGLPVDPAGPQLTGEPELVPPLFQEFDQSAGDGPVARRVGVVQRFERCIKANGA